MSKTVDILGETPKEQWLNAIGIYELVVGSNLSDSIAYFESNGGFEGAIEDRNAEQLRTANKVLKDFADEMRRLVEGVFDEQG